MAFPQFLFHVCRIRFRSSKSIFSFCKLHVHQTNYSDSYRRAFFVAVSGPRRKYSTSRSVYLLGVIASVKSLFHSTEKDAERKKIADVIREALLTYRNGNAPQSIDLLHQALSNANELGDENAVNYITDLLANIYYELMDTVKARALFLSLTDRLIASGTKKTDPSIVEISLKLADIYSMEGNDELAEQGFKFCLETQKLVVEDMDKSYDKQWLKRFKATR
ncbi:hypothetical protein D918_08747 [Trichuris suis]|nr:hypothetical protein D918_08747 [Trichuris suis]